MSFASRSASSTDLALHLARVASRSRSIFLQPAVRLSKIALSALSLTIAWLPNRWTSLRACSTNSSGVHGMLILIP